MPEPIKENYLISILYQMDGNTYVTLSPYFSKILPLLLQLLSPEQDYVLQSLQTFCNLLESKTPVLEDYLQSFVPKLLNLSQSSKFMNIRIVALQCLYNCCDYSLIKLLPLKRQVIFELTKCLDDKKRLVRKEVVRTKSRWLSIDVLNDDDD
uniref:MMS19 nucleotide excision repair protein n=1 Tax=Schizaphis graminum TaxID=13262 RepID=A0A2S2PNB9_SCHGA